MKQFTCDLCLKVHKDGEQIEELQDQFKTRDVQDICASCSASLQGEFQTIIDRHHEAMVLEIKGWLRRKQREFQGHPPE